MPEYQKLSEKELISLSYKSFESFRGNINELERAIGCLVIGQKIGWKPVLLIHDKATIKKYEKLLGLSFREVMPEIGEFADKSIAWCAMRKIGAFWKAVKGEIKGIRSPEMT